MSKILTAKEAKKLAIQSERDNLEITVSSLRGTIVNAIANAIRRGEQTALITVAKNQHRAFYTLQKEFKELGYRMDFDNPFYPNQVHIDFS